MGSVVVLVVGEDAGMVDATVSLVGGASGVGDKGSSMLAVLFVIGCQHMVDVE